MSELPINEKLIETMFNGMLLRHFGARISLFTPTTRQERTVGFDTRLETGPTQQDLLLQFKAPTWVKKGSMFSFAITPHQHHILQDKGRGRAYYIAPTFVSFCEITKCCNSSEQDAFVFFRRYIAINVQSLPRDVKEIQFNREVINACQKYDPKTPRFKKSNRWDFVNERGWTRADSLLRSFSNEDIYELDSVLLATRSAGRESVDDLDRSSAPEALTFIRWYHAEDATE